VDSLELLEKWRLADVASRGWDVNEYSVRLKMWRWAPVVVYRSASELRDYAEPGDISICLTQDAESTLPECVRFALVEFERRLGDQNHERG
jgi:hypothetical protein